ncbi:MAG TPA: UDP-N-acetylmuramate dehydrogenase [Candidatus Saccharimonadales bacterium]|nr:UDP-N-acetylmuramate dehydrogenase [Candidatus Saccharimonadales bacterium]
MEPQQNVSLANYSTMGLGGSAAYLVEITSRFQVPAAVEWARAKSLPLLMLGGGSNTIWRDEGFPGLVLINKISNFEVQQEDETNFYITVGAGENWDSVVERSVQKGLTGIEALSLIPGSAGATPVQNVGAYGQEISDTLVSVEVFDTSTNEFTTLPAASCGFGYRTSRFKTTDKHRFLITGLTIHLMKADPEPPFYAAVQSYFDEQNITNYTSQSLRDAVIAIRTAKLPDPAVVHNTGSFFANPIIDDAQLRELRDTYPTMPSWETDDPEKVKIPAAWLLDQAGLKDVHDEKTGMATWPTQPLVLINENAKSTADLLAFKQKIIEIVEHKFGITLEQEPELLP